MKLPALLRSKGIAYYRIVRYDGPVGKRFPGTDGMDTMELSENLKAEKRYIQQFRDQRGNTAEENARLDAKLAKLDKEIAAAEKEGK